MVLADGRLGNMARSSKSLSPPLTTAGRGTKETLSTAAAEVMNPLMISSVDKNAVQACFTRGGWLRIDALKIIATNDNSGSISISGEKAIFAHQGIAGGSLAATRAGPSMVTGAVASSWVVTTILSITRMLGITSRFRPRGKGLKILLDILGNCKKLLY